MPLFFCEFTLLCLYFSAHLPGCALIFLRTYPAASLSFFAITTYLTSVGEGVGNAIELHLGTENLCFDLRYLILLYIMMVADGTELRRNRTIFQGLASYCFAMALWPRSKASESKIAFSDPIPS